LPTGFKGKTGRHSDIDYSDIETRFIIKGNLTPEGHGTGNFRINYYEAANDPKKKLLDNMTCYI